MRSPIASKERRHAYQPDLAVPDAEPAIREFVRVALKAGLKHIVLLSGRGEAGAQRAEEVLRSSGIPWNIVRASWFFQNFSESFMLEGILAGELVLPAGDTVEPFVDADDIADVAVAALTERCHRNKVFEVTGPRALTIAQCISEISETLGPPVKYSSIPVDAYISALREQGGNAGSGLTLIAGTIYVAGMFVCTVVFNVPLYNVLAGLNKDSANSGEVRSHKLKVWTRWHALPGKH